MIAIDNKETEDQELWKQLPNTEGEERAELLIQLAQQALYRSSGNEALALAEQAHEIYQGLGARASSIAMANAITGIGYSLKELNRVDEATKALDGAIDLLRESKHPFLVDTLRTKASWHGEQGKWNEALAGYSEIAQINELDSNTEFYARDLFSISHCYHELGNWSEVITYGLKAREIFKEQKMVFEISWCDLNIADAHAELGENLLLAAQELVAKSSDWPQITKIERELISIYRLTERSTEADEAERRLSTLTEVVQ